MSFQEDWHFGVHNIIGKVILTVGQLKYNWKVCAGSVQWCTSLCPFYRNGALTPARHKM